MKKVFALLLVAGTFAFAACGSHEEKAAEAVDSSAVMVDTAAAAVTVDTAAVAVVDSAAAAPAAEEAHK